MVNPLEASKIDFGPASGVPIQIAGSPETLGTFGSHNATSDFNGGSVAQSPDLQGKLDSGPLPSPDGPFLNYMHPELP